MDHHGRDLIAGSAHDPVRRDLVPFLPRGPLKHLLHAAAKPTKHVR